QPRRQAAQHGAGRPEAVPTPDPDHHGVRDARPGGGDGPRRPHRGHGARQGPTNRNAPRGLRGTGRHVRGDVRGPAADEPAGGERSVAATPHSAGVSPRAFSPQGRRRRRPGRADVPVRRATRGISGLRNYAAILGDPIFLRALRNSAVVTVGSQVLVVILATAAAQVFRATFRGRRFARFVLLLPWAVPVSLAAIAWTWIFDSTFSV